MGQAEMTLTEKREREKIIQEQRNIFGWLKVIQSVVNGGRGVLQQNILYL